MKKHVLNEINMSPSANMDFMKSPIVSQIKMGFETEVVMTIEDDNMGEYGKEIEDDDFYSFKYSLARVFGQHNTDRELEEIETAILEKARELAINGISESMVVERIADNLGLDQNDESDRQQIQSVIDDENDDYIQAYDELIDEFIDNYGFSQMLLEMGYRTYGDIGNEFGMYMPDDGLLSDAAMRDIADDFENSMGVKTSYGEYHTALRGENMWAIETDSSISPDNEDEPNEYGIEIISPPMDFKTAIEMIPKVFKWCEDRNGYTNSSTGFHVGMSFNGRSIDDLDVTKLVLFLGDKHVLRDFERLSSTFCNSLLDRLTANLKFRTAHDVDFISIMKDGISKIAKNAFVKGISMVSDRYVSVNVKNTYVEFRSMGGPYFEYQDHVIDTILRYARAMSIAYDPEAEKKEYAKKLYKLFDGVKTEKQDFMKIFSMYRSGMITKESALRYIYAIQDDRKKTTDTPIRAQLINKFNNTVVGTYEGKTKAQIIVQVEKDWSRDWEKFFKLESEDGATIFESYDTSPITSEKVYDFANDLKDKLGLKSLYLSLSNGGNLHLDMIAVDKDKQKQGVGTAAMQAITDFADSHGLLITLTLGMKDKNFGTTSRTRLERFYKRFGFVKNTGRYADYALRGNMYRKPKV